MKNVIIYVKEDKNSCVDSFPSHEPHTKLFRAKTILFLGHKFIHEIQWNEFIAKNNNKYIVFAHAIELTVINGDDYLFKS